MGISPMANIFARDSREPAPVAMLAKCEPTFAPVVFGGVELGRVLARVCSKRTDHQERKKHRDCGGEGYTGISPMANIFARGSREPAPVAMLAKCEPTFAPVVFGEVEDQRFFARVCSKRTGHQERKKHRDCGGEGYKGISPMANIFARGSREPAPVAMLAKCEPTFAPEVFGRVELWRVLRECVRSVRVTENEKSTAIAVLRSW